VKRTVLLAAALVAAVSTSPTAQGTFRAGVDVVSLNVTAVDASSHYVTDLEEKDFTVFEDGVKQDLSFFNRKQQPIALSLLLVSVSVFVAGMWRIALGLFVIGWILQFIGHYFEGKPPEFFKDWRFLFVGLRWWFKKNFGVK